jgi:ABC-type branched-subunit amino acid transport system substrate-binding protein
MRTNLLKNYLLFIVAGGFILSVAKLNAQSNDTFSETGADTAVYGKTPGEYEPYIRFKKPYKRFFLDTLEYPGYGRHIQEPVDIDTVKIGFIGPIIDFSSDPTGNLPGTKLRVNQRVIRWDGYQASHLAPLGKKMLQGATLAIEQANIRGGYRDKIPFKLVVRNDNGNWRSSGREIIMLAYKDSVWAILGTIDGANSHIAIRAALKAEIPVMNSANTDPTFVETSIPWVFRCITDDRQMCYMLSDFAFKKLDLKRVAALRANNRYGRISIDEFRDAATRLGRPFVVELQYQEGDENFRAQLERIRTLNADCVLTYGNARESALILNQMREMGMQQWYLGSDRMVTQEFLNIVGKKSENVAAAYPYYPSSKAAAFIKFQTDFWDRFQEYPETYGAHAFDGINMIITAIEKAGLNRALIRDELAAMNNYEGITGKKEFDAVFTNRSPAILAILQNGKFKFYTGKEIFSEKLQFNH